MVFQPDDTAGGIKERSNVDWGGEKWGTVPGCFPLCVWVVQRFLFLIPFLWRTWSMSNLIAKGELKKSTVTLNRQRWNSSSLRECIYALLPFSFKAFTNKLQSSWGFCLVFFSLCPQGESLMIVWSLLSHSVKPCNSLRIYNVQTWYCQRNGWCRILVLGYWACHLHGAGLILAGLERIVSPPSVQWLTWKVERRLESWGSL